MSRLDLKFNKSKILSLAFFALGFGKGILYLPLFGLYFFLNRKHIFLTPIRPSFMVFFSLMMIVTIPFYVLGWSRLEMIEPLRTFISLIFFLVPAGFILQSKTQESQYKLIVLFIFGYGLQAFVFTIYSFLIDRNEYGYAGLLDPFSGEIINSPGISNSLSVFASMLIFFLFQNIGFMRKVSVFIILFLVVASAIFLGQRAFFVISVVSIFIMLTQGAKPVHFIKNFFLTSILIIMSINLLDNLDVLADSLEFLGGRFSDGLASPRFSHYLYGIRMFLEYPLGGFSVDPAIEDTKWFHNIFLDIARVAGWVPVLSLVMIITYIAITFFYKKNRYFTFGYMLFLMSFLLMQEDVIMEGNFRILVVMYYVGILLHTHSTGVQKKPLIKKVIN
jgi:hypothetical protein